MPTHLRLHETAANEAQGLALCKLNSVFRDYVCNLLREDLLAQIRRMPLVTCIVSPVILPDFDRTWIYKPHVATSSSHLRKLIHEGMVTAPPQRFVPWISNYDDFLVGCKFPVHQCFKCFLPASLFPHIGRGIIDHGPLAVRKLGAC